MKPYDWTREEAQIVKAAWATDAGRIALNLVVERLAGLMRASYDDNPLEMARNEGRRSIGIDLMRAINMPYDKLVSDEPARRRPPDIRIETATERAERLATAAR